MSEVIFLSAGIPDPQKNKHYSATADPVAISAAVSALVYVALGRRKIVWGGHPAITPMIWSIAEGLNVDYGSWVHLFQSEFFVDRYPEDNEKFRNITFTPSMGNSRERSLNQMRSEMLSSFKFSSAVFIGGMEGVIQEFNLIKKLQPKARLLPISSTGGASLELAGRVADRTGKFSNMDFVTLFHRLLDIPVNENRYQTPEVQPTKPKDRGFKLS